MILMLGVLDYTWTYSTLEKEPQIPGPWTSTKYLAFEEPGWTAGGEWLVSQWSFIRIYSRSPLLALPSKSKLWIPEWPQFTVPLQNLLPDLPPQRPIFSWHPLPQILCSSLLSTACCNKVKLLGLTPQNFWNLPIVVPRAILLRASPNSFVVFSPCS